MRRPWILLLACVLAAPAGAKPRSKARAKAKAVKLRKIALTTLGDLAAERYAAVIKRLSPELEKNLTEADLQRAWEAAAGLYGRYRRHGKVTQNVVKVRGAAYTVFDIDCQGENSRFRTRISLDKDEKIAGLFFLPPLTKIRKRR